MAMIDSDYIQQMSMQLAKYEIQASMSRAERNQKSYSSQLDAVRQLSSALKTFSSDMKAMSRVGTSMLVNSATFSQEGYATASVGTTATAGSYDFFIKQLATRHQLAVEGLQDSNVDKTGSLKLDQGAGGNFTIDLSTVDADGDGVNSLAELADAINKAADNSGVNATVVRSNGTVSLVLASAETGAAEAITLSTAGTPLNADGTPSTFATAITNARQLSAAQDAEVHLGGAGGIVMTNASNTFDQIVTGVSLTFTKAHATTAEKLTVTVGQDKTATQDKAQSFITSMNTLFSKFDSLTASGKDDGKRGPLASDPSIRFIETMLNKVVRNDYGGANLIEFGISADRKGKLTLDIARFEKAVAANPEGFDKLFTDAGGLLESIDTNLAPYINSSSGILKSRTDSLDSMLRRVDKQFDNIQKQYDTHYSRYVKQYTNMMQIMASMDETAGMFR